jgi:hypothetical protein
MITLTAKITLADGTAYEVNKRNILYLDSEIVDRSDIAMPSVGIISNRGSLQFVDYDGTVEGWINQGKNLEGKTVLIYLNDTLSKCTSMVAEYYTGKWNYDSNNRNVSVQLTDGLEEWQSIQTTTRGLWDKKSGLEIYNVLLSQSDNLSDYLWDFEELDEITSEILSNYTIEYPHFGKTNLWAAWNGLCTACGLYLYKNRNGKIVVSYDFRSE